MGQYLIDNNVISNFFSEKYSSESMAFITSIINDTPVLSIITQIEALSWVNPDKHKENIIKEFIEDAIVLTITQEIVKKCVNIRRQRKMRTPDAIIAATAVIHNLTLVTSDAGFINIPGLNVADPYRL